LPFISAIPASTAILGVKHQFSPAIVNFPVHFGNAKTGYCNIAVPAKATGGKGVGYIEQGIDQCLYRFTDGIGTFKFIIGNQADLKGAGSIVLVTYGIGIIF
jgi:hypothetical protein